MEMKLIGATDSDAEESNFHIKINEFKKYYFSGPSGKLRLAQWHDGASDLPGTSGAKKSQPMVIEVEDEHAVAGGDNGKRAVVWKFFEVTSSTPKMVNGQKQLRREGSHDPQSAMHSTKGGGRSWCLVSQGCQRDYRQRHDSHDQTPS
jgi:hypothetical protein